MTDRPRPRRESGRAVVLDRDGRILLLFGKVREIPPAWGWYTPGGRLEPGETHADAALRELEEETGYDAGSLGPCIWFRTAVRQTHDGPVEAFARFFLVPCEAFDVDTRGSGPTEDIEAWRWWSLSELREAETKALFLPSRLADLLESLLRGEIPDPAIDASDHPRSRGRSGAS